jgi:LacI family transcriptional regulator
MPNKPPIAPRPRPTIKNVAADAGVSVAAVSKVLRSAYGVSDGLRQKVLASIEKLGYRPSTGARGMRGNTFTIGVLLVEIANPFLPDVLASITETCGAEGYKVLIGIGQGELKLEESLIESMIDHGMDGLILIAPQMAGAALERFARQIPIVVLGHHESDAVSFDSVNSDDWAGTKLAVDKLYAAGHRAIEMISLTISDNTESNVSVVREKSFAACLQGYGIGGAEQVHRFPFERAQRQSAMLAMLEAQSRPTAVFCWSDLFAVELIGLARARGVRVPEDLAVIGYDNSPPAAMPLIDLTSIDQNGHMMGQVAAAALMSRIAGRTNAQHVIIKPTLFERSSHAKDADSNAENPK